MAARRAPVRRPGHRHERWLLALLAASAAAVLLAGGWASGWSLTAGGAVGAVVVLALLGWDVLPFAAMAGAVVLVVRRWPRGTPAMALGVLALAALTAALLASFVTSESSTAPLLLLFLPLYLGAVVLVATGTAVLLHAARTRWPRRTAGTAAPPPR